MRDDSGQRISERGPGYVLGISEGLIGDVVSEFYRKARLDTMLGPIFADHVVDWSYHLQLLKDFWSSVLLGSGLYKGTPMQAHLVLPNITPLHFERWLTLFEETVLGLCTPEQATLFMNRATRIAASLSMAISQKSGQEIPMRDADFIYKRKS